MLPSYAVVKRIYFKWVGCGGQAPVRVGSSVRRSAFSIELFKRFKLDPLFGRSGLILLRHHNAKIIPKLFSIKLIDVISNMHCVRTALNQLT